MPRNQQPIPLWCFTGCRVNTVHGQNDGEISFLGNNRHMRLPFLANFVAAYVVRNGILPSILFFRCVKMPFYLMRVSQIYDHLFLQGVTLCPVHDSV